MKNICGSDGDGGRYRCCTLIKIDYWAALALILATDDDDDGGGGQIGS